MAAKRVRLLPSLVNRRDADPGLLVELDGLGRYYLFDCGNLDRVSKRSLLRVSHVFVSHTHIDHFIGFDRLLRMSLGEPREIHVYGPEGLLANLAGKFAGYLWNLEEAGPDFIGHEVAGGGVRSRRFPGLAQFRGGTVDEEPLDAAAVLCRDSGLEVRFASLEHRGTSLGYRVETPLYPAVRAEALKELGLDEGPWLNELKEAAAGVLRPGARLAAGGKDWDTSELVSRLIEMKPGQRIAYVTDTLFTERTLAAVADLAHGADVLYCEANFRDEDAERARLTCHLTAGQAATFARAAGARKLVLFHLSRKYSGDLKTSLEQARAVFGNVE